MAIIQIPADLPIQLVQGDELSFALQFAGDLESGGSGGSGSGSGDEGFELSAGVFNASQPAAADLFAPGLEIAVDTEYPDEGDPITTTTVIVSFTEEQTEQLTPRFNWRWYLRWVAPGGVTRTIISGQVSSRSP